MTSILFLTLDRFDLTKSTVEYNIANCGIPRNQLWIGVCDNGSIDNRVTDWIKNDLRPNMAIYNPSNFGVAPMFNELLHNCIGDNIIIMGNDIRMPDNWAKEMESHCRAIKSTGWCGIHCVEKVGDEVQIENITVNKVWNTFGTVMMPRNTFEKIGYLCNRYAPYGLEDSDYHYRMNKSGFINYYIFGLKSEHVGDDVTTQSEYRTMKWNSLSKNTTVFTEQTQHYDATNNYYLPYHQ